MKILVLAGGYDQIGLIKELQERGHRVILADYLDSPPAQKVVDKHFQISTLDDVAVKELAVREKVDLITTACTDQALLTVAKVSEELGLPTYIDYKKALAVTNKRYMKEVFVRTGIPTAKHRIFADEEEFVRDKKDVTYPSVVKPCDCNSSKGVVKVFNEEELVVAVRNAFDMSRSHLVIVEDYIEGEEVSVDVFVDAEGTKVLSISQTEKMSNSFTIFKSKYPVNLSNNVKQKIVEIACQIAEAFELENCPMLIQAMVSNENVNVIEFSARMGGGTKYQLIEKMSGVDIMNVYVNRILGDVTQVVYPKPSDKFIELEYIYAHNGTVEVLKNFNECVEEKLIESYFQYKECGSIIEKAETSSDRVAGILFVANNPVEVREKRVHVLSRLDILDKTGKSMMIKNV